MRVIGVILDRLSPDVAVRHDDLDILRRCEFGREKRQIFHRSRNAARLDIVPGAEGPEDEQHHPRRDIGKRALQRKADGETGGAQQRDQACRLHAEFGEHREYGEYQYEVAHGIAEKVFQHLVHLRRARQRPHRPCAHPAGKPDTENENEDRRGEVERPVEKHGKQNIELVPDRGRQLVEHRENSLTG